ncbi:MAG: ABC transporter substrate-binding protein [Treponema sp.]|jgi:branched-chain amino acid transport system substrate-binding protein|nr:ABC transporter substrate-binding protein [Treponema sp.]
MKRTIKVCALAMILAVLALPVFAGGKSDGAAGDTITIGVFEPMTGANAAGGQMEVEAIRLANRLYPTVTVDGKEYKINLAIVDTKTDKVEAANAVERLIDREKASIIIGTYGSSFAIAGGEVAKEKKVPVIGTTCTNPLVTLGNDYYFRVCFIDPFQGTVMSNFAFNDQKARTAVIVQEVTNDYSVGLANFFVENFKKLTGNPGSILGTFNYQTGDQDFSAQVTQIKALNPDVIFAPGNYTESALIMKQAREQGVNCPILGGDTWDVPEFLDVGGARVEGALFSTFFDGENAATAITGKFISDYKAEYKTEPSGFAALAYDAYLLSLDAIKRAGSPDKEKIRSAIAQTKGFVGAAGVVTLDQNGDAVKAAVIKTVKNGAYVFQTVVNP